MAREKEKKGYKGFKLDKDTAEARRDREKRELERAKKNSEGSVKQSNAAFALQDGEFQEACKKADVQPTQRQASKFRNGYGKAARELGRNRRVNPEA